MAILSHILLATARWVFGKRGYRLTRRLLFPGTATYLIEKNNPYENPHSLIWAKEDIRLTITNKTSAGRKWKREYKFPNIFSNSYWFYSTVYMFNNYVGYSKLVEPVVLGAHNPPLPSDSYYWESVKKLRSTKYDFVEDGMLNELSCKVIIYSLKLIPSIKYRRYGVTRTRFKTQNQTETRTGIGKRKYNECAIEQLER